MESGVITEGSINKVLDGKQYNKTVRLHKLTYETLMRLAWSGFEEWLEANHAEALPKYNDIIRVMYKFVRIFAVPHTMLLLPTNHVR